MTKVVCPKCNNIIGYYELPDCDIIVKVLCPCCREFVRIRIVKNKNKVKITLV